MMSQTTLNYLVVWCATALRGGHLSRPSSIDRRRLTTDPSSTGGNSHSDWRPHDPPPPPQAATANSVDCAFWTLLTIHYNELRTARHLVLLMLLEIIGAWCRAQENRVLSHKDVLRTGWESIENIAFTKRFAWTGALARTGGQRLPKWIMSRKLGDAGQRVRGGREK